MRRKQLVLKWHILASQDVPVSFSQEFPNFLLVAECADMTGETVSALVRSGVVPQVTSLPAVLAPLFGKKLALDGQGRVSTDKHDLSVELFS